MLQADKIDEAITEIAYEFDLLARSTRYVSPVSPPNEEAAEGDARDRAGVDQLERADPRALHGGQHAREVGREGGR